MTRKHPLKIVAQWVLAASGLAVVTLWFDAYLSFPRKWLLPIFVSSLIAVSDAQGYRLTKWLWAAIPFLIVLSLETLAYSAQTAALNQLTVEAIKHYASFSFALLIFVLAWVIVFPDKYQPSSSLLRRVLAFTTAVGIGWWGLNRMFSVLIGRSQGGVSDFLLVQRAVWLISIGIYCALLVRIFLPKLTVSDRSA